MVEWEDPLRWRHASLPIEAYHVYEKYIGPVLHGKEKTGYGDGLPVHMP